jgi:hypothetical protein
VPYFKGALDGACASCVALPSHVNVRAKVRLPTLGCVGRKGRRNRGVSHRLLTPCRSLQPCSPPAAQPPLHPVVHPFPTLQPAPTHHQLYTLLHRMVVCLGSAHLPGLAAIMPYLCAVDTPKAMVDVFRFLDQLLTSYKVQKGGGANVGVRGWDLGASSVSLSLRPLPPQPPLPPPLVPHSLHAWSLSLNGVDDVAACVVSMVCMLSTT